MRAIGPRTRRPDRDPQWMRRLLFPDVDASTSFTPVLHESVTVPTTRVRVESQEEDEYMPDDVGRTKSYRFVEDFKDVTSLDPEYVPASSRVFEEFEEGMTVQMVNPNPYFARGPVLVGDYGKVTHFLDGVLKIKFFRMTTWSGLATDVEIIMPSPKFKIGALVRPLRGVQTDGQGLMTRATSEGIIREELAFNRFRVYFPAVQGEASMNAHDLVIMGNSNKDVKRILTKL